jgi:hypothetical protein
MTIQHLEFLDTAECAELVDYFTRQLPSVKAAHADMRWLLEHRPNVAHEVLCMLYGIDVFEWPPASSVPQWAYARAESLSQDFSGPAPGHLAQTYPQILALAVQQEGLATQFLREEASLAHAA